jgi:hypothetical protein
MKRPSKPEDLIVMSFTTGGKNVLAAAQVRL